MNVRIVCRSKIHRAVVTGADLDYVGSIGIDRAFMRATDVVPGEKVSVWNVNHGLRIDTCAIELPEGSGEVVVNGAAARHFQRRDVVIIAAFCLTDETVTPRMIAVDADDRVGRALSHDDAPGSNVREPASIDG